MYSDFPLPIVTSLKRGRDSWFITGMENPSVLLAPL